MEERPLVWPDATLTAFFCTLVNSDSFTCGAHLVLLGRKKTTTIS
jgi:hypothetical protein